MKKKKKKKKESNVRCKVARNPNTSPKTLEQLATDDHSLVKIEQSLNVPTYTSKHLVPSELSLPTKEQLKDPNYFFLEWCQSAAISQLELLADMNYFEKPIIPKWYQTYCSISDFFNNFFLFS